VTCFIFRLILYVRIFFFGCIAVLLLWLLLFFLLLTLVFVLGGILAIYVPGYCYFELFLLILFYNASW